MPHASVLAVSTGDPAGIGPEIIAKAWQARQANNLPPFMVCGGANLFAIPVRRVSCAREAADCFADALPIFQPEDMPVFTGKAGLPDSTTARLALASLEQATKLVIAGMASALITGPVAKSRLYALGFNFPGQTEYVSSACGLPADSGVMMLAGPSLRVVPVTIHIALSQVPQQLTAEKIIHAGRTVYHALRRDFGISNPRIIMAGLNPHAGEDGAIGREEIEIIAPALAALAAENIAIDGPAPADSLFHPAARARYDAVLCPAHDQALIPIKALHFDDAVNTTLGLPIIRTSPDHGTAFDIAGQGIAHASSMIAAIKMAGEAAVNRAHYDAQAAQL